jgi:hypothetical protein
MHAGVCLPHDRVSSSIPFSNTGARARFRLIPEAMFDRMQRERQTAELGDADDVEVIGGDAQGGRSSSAAEPLLTDDCAVMGALTVSPVQWDLEQGGAPAALHITFAPTLVGDSDARFVIVCSNGEVVHYRLVGECSTLQVGITAFEGVAVALPSLATSLDPAYDAPVALAPPPAAAITDAAAAVATDSLLSGLAELLDVGSDPVAALLRAASAASQSTLSPGIAESASAPAVAVTSSDGAAAAA